jgi:hypothetical protein
MLAPLPRWILCFKEYLALEFPVAKNSLVPISSIKDLASSHHGPRVSKANALKLKPEDIISLLYFSCFFYMRFQLLNQLL